MPFSVSFDLCQCLYTFWRKSWVKRFVFCRWVWVCNSWPYHSVFIYLDLDASMDPAWWCLWRAAPCCLCVGPTWLIYVLQFVDLVPALFLVYASFSGNVCTCVFCCRCHRVLAASPNLVIPLSIASARNCCWIWGGGCQRFSRSLFTGCQSNRSPLPSPGDSSGSAPAFSLSGGICLWLGIVTRQQLTTLTSLPCYRLMALVSHLSQFSSTLCCFKFSRRMLTSWVEPPVTLAQNVE